MKQILKSNPSDLEPEPIAMHSAKKFIWHQLQPFQIRNASKPVYYSVLSLHKPQMKDPQPSQVKNIDPKQWKIEVALLIYRLPIIAPPMTEVEKQFSELSEQLSHAGSYKSDFELRMNKDAILIQKRKQLEAEGRDLSDLDEQLGISTHELLDQWNKREEDVTKMLDLYNEKQYARDKHLQSIMRNTDRKLLLIVRQKFPDALRGDYVSPWIFPQLKNESGETLRQTAERCMTSIVAPEILDDVDDSAYYDEPKPNPYDFRINGNAPIGHTVFRFSKQMREHLGHEGRVLFFYPVQIFPNKKSKATVWEVAFNTEKVIKHKWCTREELEQINWRSKYWKAIQPTLIE